MLCVVGLFAAVISSHEAFGEKKKKPAKKNKKEVLHVTMEKMIERPLQSQPGPEPEPGDILLIGHVVTVAPEAVAGHLAHGDTLDFEDIDSESPWQGLTWRQLAEWNQMDTEGADAAAIRGQ